MESRRRFKFLKELAQGGFGKVYLAKQITGDNFETTVAIKLLHGKWTDNAEIVMRSRDEARLLGLLRHRNIVKVENLTAINGQCAVVMEYLAGIDLKAICVALREANKPFPRKSVFEATGAIAAALDAAYTYRPSPGDPPLQVIHRDIKPSNAIITIEGDLKVLDFGTARASFENREAKTQVLAFGSQAYMAPERMLGELDAPSGDVFSLGITLYELLTLDNFGKIPLRQERFEPAVLARIDAIDLADMTPGLQEQTRSVLGRMLAYEHDQRPSASDLIELMDNLGDEANDAGLKRFARETVKKLYESHAPEQDPNDPYNGQTLGEDSTGTTNRSQTTGPIPNLTQAFSPDGDQEFQVPPELAEPPIDLPGSRPNIGAEGPAAYASPPAPPRGVSSVMPFNPGGQGAEVASVPAGGTPLSTAPPSVDTKSGPRGKPSPAAASGSNSAPTLATGARVAETVEAPPAGGAGKIIAGLVVIGGLGLVTAAALSFTFWQSPPAPTPPSITPVVARVDLVSGTPTMDWSPNVGGKGGAILRIPDGASEVVITGSGTGFREEWDGTGNLRLKELEPVGFRTKVKSTSGGSQLSDFLIEADKTCVFTFKSGNWERGECR